MMNVYRRNIFVLLWMSLAYTQEIYGKIIYLISLLVVSYLFWEKFGGMFTKKQVLKLKSRDSYKYIFLFWNCLLQCYEMTRRCSPLHLKLASPLAYALYSWSVHCKCAIKQTYRHIWTIFIILNWIYCSDKYHPGLVSFPIEHISCEHPLPLCSVD